MVRTAKSAPYLGNVGSIYPSLGLLWTVATWALVFRCVIRSGSAWTAAAWSMWAGFWYFATTMHWVGTALTAGSGSGTESVLLTAAGSLGCTALFFPWWGLAAFVTRRIWAQPSWSSALAFSAIWSISDFLLGDFIFGLPLGSISLVTLDTPAAALLPILGTQGTSMMIVWAGSAVGAAVGSTAGRLHALIPYALLTLSCVASTALLAEPEEASLTPIALVQLDQPMPVGAAGAGYEERVERVVLETTARAFAQGAELVVFPESTFLTDPFVDGQTFVQELQARIPADRTVLLGARSVETSGDIGAPHGGFSVQVYNSASFVTSEGVSDQYRKTHLAIFGEYMPRVFRLMGFDVIGGPIGGLSAGGGLRSFELEGLPRFSLSICYEALMSGPLQRSIGESRFLLNISNEYLFGRSIGAALILQYNRMRSAELGLPTLRSTMTGHSGVIDATGKVITDAPMSTAQLVITSVPASIQTPFRKIGYTPTYAIIILFLVTALMGRRKP
jgi:apolipoprotein N-acyltransferase